MFKSIIFAAAALIGAVQANQCNVVSITLDTDYSVDCQCAVAKLIEAANEEIAHKVCGARRTRSLAAEEEVDDEQRERELQNCGFCDACGFCQPWCYVFCSRRRLDEIDEDIHDQRELQNEDCSVPSQATDAGMRQFLEYLEDRDFVEVVLDQAFIDGFARALDIYGKTDDAACVRDVSASTLAVMMSAQA